MQQDVCFNHGLAIPRGQEYLVNGSSELTPLTSSVTPLSSQRRLWTGPEATRTAQLRSNCTQKPISAHISTQDVTGTCVPLAGATDGLLAATGAATTGAAPDTTFELEVELVLAGKENAVPSIVRK